MKLRGTLYRVPRLQELGARRSCTERVRTMKNVDIGKFHTIKHHSKCITPDVVISTSIYYSPQRITQRRPCHQLNQTHSA